MTTVVGNVLQVRRWGSITLGIVGVLLGGLFFLQGIGLVGGSSMTGDRMWLFVGLVMVLVGLALLVAGARSRGQRT
ncbi:MAG: hypothetical protein ACRDS0_06835 [Pseudonocardiaceae bacterium]